MAVWFNKQSRLVQILLLLIPGVNWVVEILIRWSAFLHTKSLVTLLFAILVTFAGFAFGLVEPDLVPLFKASDLCESVKKLS